MATIKQYKKKSRKYTIKSRRYLHKKLTPGKFNQLGGLLDCSRELGKGGFGRVNICMGKLGDDAPQPLLAIKFIYVNQQKKNNQKETEKDYEKAKLKAIRQIVNEYRLGITLNHPNIVKTYTSDAATDILKKYTEPDSQTQSPQTQLQIYNGSGDASLGMDGHVKLSQIAAVELLGKIEHKLFLEICLTDLHNLVKIPMKVTNLPNAASYFNIATPSVTFENIRICLRQIFAGLQYLYNQKIIHFDIKPKNILLKLDETGQIVYKISDLGFASINDGTMANAGGTKGYQPRHLGVRYNKCTHYRDLFAFGCIGFELLQSLFVKPSAIKSYLVYYNLLKGVKTLDKIILEDPLQWGTIEKSFYIPSASSEALNTRAFFMEFFKLIIAPEVAINNAPIGADIPWDAYRQYYDNLATFLR